MNICMNRIGRWLAVLAMALFAVMGLSRDARAGSLQIRDEAQVLSPGDVTRLRSAVDAAPFDARLIFTIDYAEAQDLSQVVGSMVNRPDVVAVGVDPHHRHVEVHFGTGSGIPRAAWPAIERAGNAAFRNGQWEAGAAAIFRAASDAVNPGAVEHAPLSSARSPSFVSSGLFLLLGIAAIIGMVAFFFARRRPPYDGPGGGYPSSGGYPYGGPGGYGNGPYGPTYPASPAGGMGPLGGGLVGAGLGGLAGYELGKLEGEREERDRDIGVDRGIGREDLGRDDVGRDGDYDAGGGGSSWDEGGNDPGDDGGGFDGGGDSGGGFDGGGDSGGGSDF